MDKLKKLVEDLKAEKEVLKKRYKLAKAGKPLPQPESDSDGENEDGAPKKKKKALPSDPIRIKKAIGKLDERIQNRLVEIEQKDELKTIALGTSKINYMDPRITAAWCKKHYVCCRHAHLWSPLTNHHFHFTQVPIEKIFSKTLRDKFPWAMDADAAFTY